MSFPPGLLEVPSPQTGTTYQITLAAPGAPAAGRPWRAALFLDGDDQLRPAVEAYGALHARGEAPPTLLVGVGYGGSYRSPKNRRTRDYTTGPIEGAPDGGGAEAFHAFLVETLWPELARRFPLAGEPILGGHSLGALFGLHALWRERPFFTRVLASAPSIWWGDGAVLQAAAALRDRQATLEGRLFLGIGEADSRSMREDFVRCETVLRERPFAGLRVTTQRFPGRDHFDVLPVAFAAGLRALLT